MKHSVFMLGEGAWGTAVSMLLARNGHTVFMWCHDHTVAQQILETRINERYMPGIELNERIVPVVDFAVLPNVAWIYEAIPVNYLRGVLYHMVPHVQQHHRWVLLSKGIEQEKLLFPSEIIDDIFGANVTKIVCTGPSFAKDLIARQITGVLCASDKEHELEELAAMIAASYLRPFLSQDTIGAQVAGALKNVVALALGMLDGAGYADNAKALVFTQILRELCIVIEHKGGVVDTAYGLAGVGDMVLTALSVKSRNFYVGQQLGAGHEIAAILDKTGYIPEGLNTIKSIYALTRDYHDQVPLLLSVYDIINSGKRIETLLDKAMQLH